MTIEKPKSAAEKAKQAELAKIHIAKKRLGLDDDVYRAMLERVVGENPPRPPFAKGGGLPMSKGGEMLTARGRVEADAGVYSAKHLTAAGRRAVLEHLKAAGFKGSKAYPGKPHSLPSDSARSAQLGKIEAQLADAGRAWAYAIAMAWRMYKKHKLEFCDGRELAGIITALVKDQKKRAVAGGAVVGGAVVGGALAPVVEAKASPTEAAHG